MDRTHLCVSINYQCAPFLTLKNRKHLSGSWKVSQWNYKRVKQNSFGWFIAIQMALQHDLCWEYQITSEVQIASSLKHFALIPSDIASQKCEIFINSSIVRQFFCSKNQNRAFVSVPFQNDVSVNTIIHHFTSLEFKWPVINKHCTACNSKMWIPFNSKPCAYTHN